MTNVRKGLILGPAMLGLLGVLAAVRSSGSEPRVRPARRAVKVTQSPITETEPSRATRLEANDVGRIGSAASDIMTLDASELCAKLETADSPDSVLAAMFVLGNTAPVGPREVEVLLRALSRWDNDVVRCQTLWALGLAEEAYPLAAVLNVLRAASSTEVRCAALASMAVHLDDGMKKALRDELCRETDVRLRDEVERSLRF